MGSSVSSGGINSNPYLMNAIQCYFDERHANGDLDLDTNTNINISRSKG